MDDLAGIVMKFTRRAQGDCISIIESHAQHSFCLLSARFIETCEAAVILASNGFYRQADGVMRAALEGLAYLAILARRPEFHNCIIAFELADRHKEFNKLRTLRETSDQDQLSAQTLAVDLENWESEFTEKESSVWNEYIKFHKRFSFELSRDWQPYNEESYLNFNNYTPPQSIEKPKIWKLFQFGKWLPDAMQKIDLIFHSASLNSHFNLSTLNDHLDGAEIRQERLIDNPDLPLAQVLEIVFLWFALAAEFFSLDIDKTVESMILKKVTLLNQAID